MLVYFGDAVNSTLVCYLTDVLYIAKVLHTLYIYPGRFIYLFNNYCSFYLGTEVRRLFIFFLDTSRFAFPAI